jgi:RHS repeat-associated protein
MMKIGLKRLIATAGVFLSATLGGVQGFAASTITYYHNDLLGSPVAATDASGHVIWRESYRPYGERLTNDPASSGNDVWYTSRRQDADTGLVYMGARYYDPAVGRFVSKDPVGFDEKNVQSFNRYAYGNDNPYRFVDPNGKMGQLVLAAAGATVLLVGADIYLSDPDRRAAIVASVSQGAANFRANLDSIRGTLGSLIFNEGADESGSSSADTDEGKDKGSSKGTDETASDKTAKDIAKRIERDLGKDARRQFHDAKSSGEGDRTMDQLKQDARDAYTDAGKDIPDWLK